MDYLFLLRIVRVQCHLYVLRFEVLWRILFSYEKRKSYVCFCRTYRIICLALPLIWKDKKVEMLVCALSLCLFCLENQFSMDLLKYCDYREHEGPTPFFHGK